jgi:DNA-binding winged helix-turn-helix (wHTH) protein
VRFLVLPHRRELLADGQPNKLGRRAFGMLMALIEAPPPRANRGPIEEHRVALLPL